MAQSITYKVEDEKYKVIYSKDIIDRIIKDIRDLKSDQKILFIYDKNIKKKIY